MGRGRSLLGIIVGFCIIAAAVLVVRPHLHRAASFPFQDFTITQVTRSGNVRAAAISPDGKFAAFVAGENRGFQTMWLRNVSTGSDTLVVSPSQRRFKDLLFSPDGNYIYFRQALGDFSTFDYDLYRVPVLGGPPQLVVHAIDSVVAISPDSRSIAFARADNRQLDRYEMLVANSEGSEEKRLYQGSLNQAPRGLAWSPNRDEFAYSQGSRDTLLGSAGVFDLALRRDRPLPVSNNSFLSDLAWSPDGRALFVNYWPRGPNYRHGQIGVVPLSGARLQSITRDTYDYSTITAAADGKTLASVQTKSVENIYVLPADGGMAAKSSPLLLRTREFESFHWSADGGLLITERSRISRVAADGTYLSQLIADPDSLLWSPVNCGPDTVVFLWFFHDHSNMAQLWRIHADGSNPAQLTYGLMDLAPVCSPDHKWTYYQESNTHQIWRVPPDGSRQPEPIKESSAFRGLLVLGAEMSVSPDGSTLAYWVEDIDPDTRVSTPKIALLDLAAPRPPRLLHTHGLISRGPQFTPDGKAIAYVVEENEVGNLWVEPLNGTVRHPITHFATDAIASFHWSPDGKKLAVLRTHSESDVVFLKETNP